MGTYVKKTDRRRYEDRSFSVRAVHRDGPDLHKLAEALIRLTLHETGASRTRRRATEPPDTYRAHPEVGVSVPDGPGRLPGLEPEFPSVPGTAR